MVRYSVGSWARCGPWARGPVGPGMTGLSLKRAVLQIRGSGLRAWDVGFWLSSIMFSGLG